MPVGRFTSADSTRIWELLNRLADDVELLVDERTPPWSLYTPSWTDGGNNLAIGNGSLRGAWTKVRNTVFWHILLVRGSTTNQGGGNWVFGLPTPATTFAAVAGAGTITGPSKALPITVMGVGPGVIGLMTPSGRVSNNVPGSWAANDTIALGFQYQIGA